MRLGVTDLDRVIAANIRLYRLEQRWTQARLAMALSMSPQQLQKYETAKNRISAARLFQIADLLGVPVQAFRERQEGMVNN